jgi:hypothetical protein
MTAPLLEPLEVPELEPELDDELLLELDAPDEDVDPLLEELLEVVAPLELDPLDPPPLLLEVVPLDPPPLEVDVAPPSSSAPEPAPPVLPTGPQATLTPTRSAAAAPP